MDFNPKDQEQVDLRDQEQANLAELEQKAIEKKKIKDKEELESLEELRQVMKKLEKMSKNQPQSKPRRRSIAIEFGGVFHHNRLVNFVFTYILTFTIAFFISELFNFVSYRDIIYFAGVILMFNLFEEIIRTFMLMRFFKVILRTFGTVFYFIYVIEFYFIDQFVFTQSFSFVNEFALPFFVLFLAVTRYVFGQVIRNFLRYQTMR